MCTSNLSRHVAWYDLAMNDSFHDGPGQDATPPDNPQNPPDLSIYTHTVVDALEVFKSEGMSVTDRTIQRYCHGGKLRALKIDPDTRHPTDKDNGVFLIDPTSIKERITLLREKAEFASPTVVATGRDTSGQDATGRDTSRQQVVDDWAQEQTKDDAGETKKLHDQITSLEIDKRVRDAMLDQMKTDREELLKQLDAHVKTMNEQSRIIGRLETRLELAAPEPGQTQPQPVDAADVRDAVEMAPEGQEELFKGDENRDDRPLQNGDVHTATHPGSVPHVE